MLIRITHKKEGIEHYLETGQKSGRELSRQELDNRVHISGDLTSFSTTVKYSRENKDWENHYFHITASFSIEDNDISDEKLKMIHSDLMDYYFCGYDKNNIVHACEAHRPIFQTVVDNSTSEVKQRLLHIHNAVAKYDPVTGNQIRMIPFNLKSDRAFQSYICEKYNLQDPADHKREIPVSKKDIIARWHENPSISKQTKVSDLRKLFSSLVNDCKTLDEVSDILLATNVVNDVSFKIQKSGNKYLQVQTNEGTRNINLRGKGFEQLEKLYYKNNELSERLKAGKYFDIQKRTSQDNKAIFEDHKKWFLEQQELRVPKKIDYSKTQKKYENYFQKYTKEQRHYFVIYRSNIQEESIRGYRIFNKNNERHLVNNDLGVKIFDRPGQICLEIPDDPSKRESAVKLALAMAISKGWNLEKMTLTGSFEFKEEVKKQITQINQPIKVVNNEQRINKLTPSQRADKLKPLSLRRLSKRNLVRDRSEKRQEGPGLLHTNALDNRRKNYRLRGNDTPLVAPILSAASQALKDAKSEQRLSKEDITIIKSGLDAHSVIQHAIEKYGLLGEHFTVTNDNKILDSRTRAKPKNVIDFITKTCNVNISDAMLELQQLHEQQISNEDKMDLSVCTSNNPNGLGGWVHKQPQTFTELAGLVKSHQYAAFTDLKDNYRKAENVVALGNCAIFDIDNDPNQPQLSISQAQDLLKDTTFMLVTSKSHQVDKVKGKGDILPAVDRYRIIVPMAQSLSTNRDEYRLSMVKLSEQLGLSEYADPKALKDIARQYYQSPVDAQVIINNTKSAVDSSPIIVFATQELQRLEAEKQAARKSIIERSLTDKSSFASDQAEYPLIINLDAINQLPLPEIYQIITGRELTQEGSYLMGQGITSGTSKSRESFTIFESDSNWLWHDFKTNESGNVVTFMREAAGMNVFETAQMLAEHFNVDLMSDNITYYKNALSNALSSSTNDKELLNSIKLLTSAKFAKLEKDTLKIGDKEFPLSELGFEKIEIINQLRKNRNELSL